MKFEDINPYLRFAEIQPSMLQGDSFRLAYDYRVIYIISGQGTLMLDSQELSVFPDSVVMIPPATRYYFVGAMQVVMLNFDLFHTNSEKKTARPPDNVVNFKPELVFEDVLIEELCRPIVLHDCSSIHDLLNDLIAERNFKKLYYSAVTSAYLKNVICNIVRRNNKTYDEENNLVSKALIFIKTNYHNPIKNSDISKALGYNDLYLNRLFKQQLGTTMHKCLINERIKMAKTFLKDSDISIENIAQNCGFNSLSTFFVLFKKTTGFSPKQYRDKR